MGTIISSASKRNRALFATLAFSVAAMLSVHCSSSSDPGIASHKPRIALVAKALNDPYMQGLIAGAKADQLTHSEEYDLIALGTDSSTNVDQQISLVQQQIDAKVDAILISPLDSTKLGPVCQKAIDAGILVVNFDTRFAATALKTPAPFVGPNNQTGAAKVGTYLSQKLRPGDPVAIITGKSGSITSQLRQAGYEQSVRAAGMTIVEEETGNSNRVDAKTAATTIFTNHPEVKAIFVHNGVSSEGVVDAFKAAGKVGQIKLGGFDFLNNSEFQGMLHDGSISVTANQHGDQQGVFTIQYALYILATHAPLQDRETPVDLVLSGP